MITLTCRDCRETAKFPPLGTVDGVPVLQWFTSRNERCQGCFRRHEALKTAGYRKSDPQTSKQGACDVAPRAGSQRHKLLVAYAEGGAMTADEAVRLTDINIRSCYWKRVSELLAAGLLEDAGITRLGEQGSLQRVNAITAKGRLAL